MRTTRSGDVERVRRQLEQWRRGGGRGRRIPESLWKAVVQLARGQGVSKAARALGLDYYTIKNRLEATAEGSDQRFVELPLRGLPGSPACVLEVEDGRGARLRLELQGLDAGDLAGVVRSVWSESR